MTDTRREKLPWAPLILGFILTAAVFWCLWLIWERIQEENSLRTERFSQLAILDKNKRRIKELLAMEPCAAVERMAAESSTQGTSQPLTSASPESALPRARLSAIDSIEAASVFLVSVAGGRIVSGSGFFVAPGLILTNRHVVDKSDKVFVTNKYLDRPLVGKVAALGKDERHDCALVAVDASAGPLPAPLRFADNARKTQKVGAWGYPELVGRNDPAYAALLNGEDFTATPELSYSEGVISAIIGNDPPLIVHTAPISPGSSGGPLVNEKGEVVGINSQITVDEESYRQASIAIAVSAIKDFLLQNGIKSGSGAAE